MTRPKIMVLCGSADSGIGSRWVRQLMDAAGHDTNIEVLTMEELRERYPDPLTDIWIDESATLESLDAWTGLRIGDAQYTREYIAFDPVKKKRQPKPDKRPYYRRLEQKPRRR